MSAARSLLSRAGVLLAASAAWLAAAEPARIVVVGDVMLSRQVDVEIARTGTSPFALVAPLLSSATLAIGNLEGAVGDGCEQATDEAPCFAIRRELLGLAGAAGLDALSVENNHAGDLGAEGRVRTVRALEESGLLPLSFASSPRFVDAGDAVVALVAVSVVPGRDGAAQEVPSWELARKLRLARALADVVIVAIHWGAELVDWPSADQRRAASWLASQGVDLVAGSHPHVVQPVACIDGTAVFHSLGNHVFDQRYPETKRGLIADCRIGAAGLSCSAIATRTRRGSSRPELGGEEGSASCELAACGRPRPARLAVSGIALRPRQSARGTALEGIDEATGRRLFRTPAMELLAIQRVRLGGEEALLTIERHDSPIDGERAPRPYVYRVTPRGLFATWRGSALAWPLLDARFVPASGDEPGGGCLCALHRADSFLAPDPAAPPGRTAAYRWNGFGFSGEGDAALEALCRELFTEAWPGGRDGS